MLINEFLPNPAGNDRAGEFIELWNEKQTSQNLTGFRIEDKSGKKFFLKGNIAPHGYLVLPYKISKISLSNNGEALYLYDPSGALIDKAKYQGSAKEGASFSRIGDVFQFTNAATPGAQNIFKSLVKIEPGFNLKEAGSIIVNSLSILEVIFIGLALAAIMASVFIYYLKDVILFKDAKAPKEVFQ